MNEEEKSEICDLDYKKENENLMIQIKRLKEDMTKMEDVGIHSNSKEIEEENEKLNELEMRLQEKHQNNLN